jgi:hypothetical protein
MNRMHARHLQDARVLKQLREWRERAARRQRQAACEACDAARQAVQAGQARVAALQCQRQALGTATLAAAAAGQWACLSWARPWREELDDRIERAAYALIDAEDALAEAEARQARAGHAWRQAQGRVQAAQALVDQVRQGLTRTRERVEEEALADETPRGVQAAWGLAKPGGPR